MVTVLLGPGLHRRQNAKLFGEWPRQYRRTKNWRPTMQSYLALRLGTIGQSGKHPFQAYVITTVIARLLFLASVS